MMRSFWLEDDNAMGVSCTSTYRVVRNQLPFGRRTQIASACQIFAQHQHALLFRAMTSATLYASAWVGWVRTAMAARDSGWGCALPSGTKGGTAGRGAGVMAGERIQAFKTPGQPLAVADATLGCARLLHSGGVLAGSRGGF